MPLYDERCAVCGHRFEQLVRTQPVPSLLACPSRGQTTARRQFGSFATVGRAPAACPPATGG